MQRPFSTRGHGDCWRWVGWVRSKCENSGEIWLSTARMACGRLAWRRCRMVRRRNAVVLGLGRKWLGRLRLQSAWGTAFHCMQPSVEGQETASSLAHSLGVAINAHFLLLHSTFDGGQAISVQAMPLQLPGPNRTLASVL